MRVPARVVIVEDEADVRELIRVRLSLEDHFDVVGEATDAASALVTVAAEQPDIVVLDIRVPGSTGTELIPQVLHAAPGAKVAVFTGVPPELMRDEVLARGALGYVVKGDVERLVEALDVLIDRAEVATRDFPGDLPSVRLARRFAADSLRSWDLDYLLDPATLIVSELATNAVVHAQSPFTLRLAVTRGVLRVEVSDCGPGVPEPIDPDPTGVGGRGLQFVSQLSTAWGVVADHPPCKTVWCELELRHPVV